MEAEIPKGTYIVAVSGGVDSMVLLHRLKSKPWLNLVVAHFNHGIRPDSADDEELVRKIAAEYQLPFEVGYGKLGPAAGEARARQARYGYLKAIQETHNGRAIMTAHHQDDVLETVLINILRGSGRRGLTAIMSNKGVLRPLLAVPKKEILRYAVENGLKWREDSSNNDTSYLRNYVRAKILPRLAASQRNMLLKDIGESANRNMLLDDLLAKLSQIIIDSNGLIDRSRFNALPAELGDELMIFWLRQRHILSYDRKTIDRLGNALKTARPHTQHKVNPHCMLMVDKQTACFSSV